jgi:hypothetical protein
MVRNTGRTFRAVLSAIYAASDGANSVLIVNNQSMREYTMKRIEQIIDLIDVMPHRHDKVIFPNGKELHLLTISDVINSRLRGIARNTYVISDVEYYEIPPIYKDKFYDAMTDWHERAFSVSQREIV